MYGLAPYYLRDVLPPLVHETTYFNFRNANHIQTLILLYRGMTTSFFRNTIGTAEKNVRAD